MPTLFALYSNFAQKSGDTKGVPSPLTITLTDKQDQWIKTQIAAGEFTNDSEYIRDLVRRDQEQNAQYMALKQAIQEGFDSGVSKKTVGEIWEEAKQGSKDRR